MTFRIESQQLVEGTHVVSFAGELDLYTAPDVEAALLERFSDGATRVVVDLTDTTFVDSVALGVFVRSAGHLQRIGGRLAIASPPEVARFFELAGLEHVFAIAPTRARALAAVARPLPPS